MNFRVISPCIKSLDFLPLVPVSEALPGYAWQGFQISHFSQAAALDRSPVTLTNGPSLWLEAESSLEQILKILYPKLTLPELSRLLKVLEENNIQIDRELFFQSYQFKWTSDLETTLHFLQRLSPLFQNWISIKDLGWNEIRILKYAFHNYEESLIQKATNFIAEKNPSRHHGAKILEWIFSNLDEQALALLLDCKTAEEIYHQLYQKKYKVSLQQDQKGQELVRNVPWPAHIKAEWVRAGDRSGIQLQVFSSHCDDLNKKINQLSQLKEKIENLWK